MPGLLPRGVSPRAATPLAQVTGPFGKAIKLAFTSDTHRRVEFTNERPKLAKCLRRMLIHRLKTLSSQRQPARLRLTRELPSKAPARSLKILLIILLITELNYSGVHHARDLVYGMCIVGLVGAKNSLAARDISAKTNLGRTKAPLRARTLSVSKTLSVGKNPTLKKATGPIDRGIPQRMGIWADPRV